MIKDITAICSLHVSIGRDNVIDTHSYTLQKELSSICTINEDEKQQIEEHITDIMKKAVEGSNKNNSSYAKVKFKKLEIFSIAIGKIDSINKLEKKWFLSAKEVKTKEN